VDQKSRRRSTFQVSDTHKPLHWRARCIQTTLTSLATSTSTWPRSTRTSTSKSGEARLRRTGAFFAVLVPEDLHHERARVIFTRAGEERWQLVTTNMVVIETYALLLNRAHGGRPSALAFLDAIERDEYQIERVKESDEAAAIELVRSHEDKTYSLCDA